MRAGRFGRGGWPGGDLAGATHTQRSGDGQFVSALVRARREGKEARGPRSREGPLLDGTVLACGVCLLVGLAASVIYPHTGPVLSISQQELGELAGMSRQRANGTVSKLKKAGVQGQYGAIVVLDLPAPKAIAKSGLGE